MQLAREVAHAKMAKDLSNKVGQWSEFFRRKNIKIIFDSKEDCKYVYNVHLFCGSS